VKDKKVLHHERLAMLETVLAFDSGDGADSTNINRAPPATLVRRGFLVCGRGTWVVISRCLLWNRFIL
jgi:hypothetical protein